MPHTVNEIRLTAAADDDGRRLDRILRKALRDLPLSGIHRLLRQGSVQVDGKRSDAAQRIKAGETITISNIEKLAPAPSSSPHGENSFSKDQSEQIRQIESIILFEGAGLLALNKPRGTSVHGGGKIHKAPLDEMVRSYLAPKLPSSLSFRPGPLHRLDTPSSGVLVFSTSLEGALTFSALMRERRVKKFYLALVEGIIKEPESWQDELRRDSDRKKTFLASACTGKDSITTVTPLAHNDSCTLILAEIKTGRTHQIRAQARAHGKPLRGDAKYGGSRSSENGGLLLHAWRMEFPDAVPSENKFPRLIEAPLPPYFQAAIRPLSWRDLDWKHLITGFR